MSDQKELLFHRIVFWKGSVLRIIDTRTLSALRILCCSKVICTKKSCFSVLYASSTFLCMSLRTGLWISLTHRWGLVFFRFIYLILCIWDFCLHVCMYTTMYILDAWEGQKRVSSSRTAVTDGCQPLCGCWDLNSDPLEEQPMFLPAEPFLQLL